MSKKPLKATDRRRNRKNAGIPAPDTQGNTGVGAPLADLFNDRRGRNGQGKKAS